MMSLAFAVCIFHYAAIRYNCAAVHKWYALDSVLRPSILQLVVLIMLVLWRCGHSFVLSRKRSSVHGSNLMISANVSVIGRRG